MSGRGEPAGRAREWAAVGAVFLAIVTVASVWLSIDRQPPAWDYASHLENALHCRNDLARGDLAAVFGRSPFYPPLVSCAGALVYAVLPSDVAFGEVVMLAFLGLGMAATYVLGRRFGGGGGGVVAAVAFGTAPIVVHHALHFQLDVPVASMVATFLAVLLEAEHFERRAWSLAAGALFGLGLLTKPPFLVFVAPAGLLVLARTRGRRAWLHATLAGLVAILVALPWYGPRVFGLLGQIQNRSFKQAAEAGAPAAFSSVSLAYYPLNFPTQVGVVAVPLLLIGVAVAARRRCWYVLAGVAPVLVFLLIQNKQMRYVLPLLPMMSVAGGIGFAALPRPGRRIAGVAVAAVGAFQLVSTAFPGSAMAGLPGLRALRASPAPASASDWRHRAILDAIVRDGGGRPPTVSVVPNHQHFSPANFRYYALRDGLGLRVTRGWEGEPLGVEYMILKTGDLGPPWTTDKAERAADRLAADASLARAFPVIGEFALPDGSTASIRARRLAGDVGASPDALARALDAGLRARLGEVTRDVEGLDVRLDYDAGIVRGRVRRVEIAAAAATVGELRRRQSALLRVRDLLIVIDDALVNPWSALAAGRFDPLDAGRVTIERATVDAAALQAFVGQVKGIGRMSLSLGTGFVDLAFRAAGPDVTARVRLAAAADRPFVLRAERVTVGGVPLPAMLVGWVMNSVDPSRGIAGRLPFPAIVRPVTVTPAAIHIGTAGEPRSS